MKQSAYLFKLAVALLILSILVLHSCGIYTTTAPLNPPFFQGMDSISLKFSGNNDEEYFVGYNIYYKEKPEDRYKVCDNISIDQYPTIPASPSGVTVEYNVDTNDIRKQGVNYSFYDLYYTYNEAYLFAVSAVGDEDQESERIEFGSWPIPAVQ